VNAYLVPLVAITDPHHIGAGIAMESHQHHVQRGFS
jgi:hypothetical protein